MGGRQVAPGAVPGKQLLPRHVREVDDGPVDVPALVVGRELAVVEAVAVRDPVGADHTRVADVDHVRVDHVQPDPEADEEDQSRKEKVDRHVRHELAHALAAAPSLPQHSPHHVEQHGIGERHRHPDLAAVEEHVRDAEGEQHEQVEVEQAQRAAEVHERQEEQQPERYQEQRRVPLAAERSLVAARHPPGDLVAGPRLEDRARSVVHVHLHELVAVGEPRHLPPPGRARVRGRP